MKKLKIQPMNLYDMKANSLNHLIKCLFQVENHSLPCLKKIQMQDQIVNNLNKKLIKTFYLMILYKMKKKKKKKKKNKQRNIKKIWILPNII